MSTYCNIFGFPSPIKSGMGMTEKRHRIYRVVNKVFASKYKLALPSEKELKTKLKFLQLLEGRRKKRSKI